LNQQQILKTYLYGERLAGGVKNVILLDRKADIKTSTTAASQCYTEQNFPIETGHLIPRSAQSRRKTCISREI
jgi:hypothetical protein